MFRFGQVFGVPSLLPFLKPDGEGGGSTGASGPAGPGEGASGVSGASGASGPAIPADVQKLIDTAAANARREGEKAGKQAAEAAAKQAEEDAKTKREQDEAIKRGEFDTVKASLETERDTAKAEVKTLTDQIAEYERVIGPIVDERAKALEGLGDKDLLAAYPKDADSLTKIKWLDDPRLKPLLAKQTEHASNLLKWPKNPNPQNTETTDEQARASQGRMYNNF